MAKPEEMDQDALLAAVRRRPWERRLVDASGWIALVIDIVATVALDRLGAPLPVVVGVFFGLGLALLIKIIELADFRARHFQRELLWRFGPRDARRLTDEAESSMRSADAPDWILILSGRMLPHGGTIDVRLDLRQGASIGSLDLRRSSQVDFGKEPPFTSENGTRSLTTEECADLLTQLNGVDAAKSGEISTFVRDGFPCKLVVLRRDPQLRRRYECNLTGVPEENRNDCGPVLMELMLELSETITKTPMIIGSCDAFGNIKIDQR